jgi:spore coat polysaccharide biosynthesis protein SpsF
VIHKPVVTIIQARVGSSRLPGKVLAPLAGEPALLRIVERVRASSLAGNVVVATTLGSEDDRIEAICRASDIPVFRGHRDDLLDRHVRAGRFFGARHVVKIPSDCPLIDPAAIDRVLSFYLGNVVRYDYVSNLHPQSWPDGNDVEVMRFSALETAWREADRSFEREHTTPFLWDRPERFRIGNVRWGTGLDLSKSHRFVVDYQDDYEFAFEVYEALYRAKPLFGTDDVLDLLAVRPDLFDLNSRYAGVNWYRHHLEELRTVGADDTRMPGEAA